MIGTATAIGSIISLIAQGYGMWRQEQQNQDIRAQSKQWREEDIARDEGRYQTQLKQTKDAIRYQKQEKAKQWRWNEEERNYGRVRDFQANLLNVMNQKPQFQEQLMKIWPSRRYY